MTCLTVPVESLWRADSHPTTTSPQSPWISHRLTHSHLDKSSICPHSFHLRRRRFSTHKKKEIKENDSNKFISKQATLFSTGTPTEKAIIRLGDFQEMPELIGRTEHELNTRTLT